LNRSAVCLHDIPPITIVNPVPSIDTILIKLCVLLTMPVASATAEMPVASATAEMPVSVLRRLKTYVRSTMKNPSINRGVAEA
jgi:ubiquitin-protein ligase